MQGIPGEGESAAQTTFDSEQLAFYKPILYEPVRDEGHRLHSGAVALSSPRAGSSLQPWPIPESVFFVYAEASAGRDAAHQNPSATAFVVSVPRLDHRGRLRFLVTARHVVDPEWAHCADENPSALDVRFNRVNGGSAFEHIPLEINHVRNFLTPADGTADIAVIPLDERVVPNIALDEFMDTPFRLLPTASDLAAIRGNKRGDGAPLAGRQIVTVSLRKHVDSEDRDYPLSGAGMLSSTTAAPVDIRCGAASSLTTLKLWTIDASVPQEVSGAPVYTTMIRGAGNIESPVLLGVQSVAWPGRLVAGITPADALGDLIQKALGSQSGQMDLYRGPLR